MAGNSSMNSAPNGWCHCVSPSLCIFLTSFVILRRISEWPKTWRKKSQIDVDPIILVFNSCSASAKIQPFCLSIFQIRLSSYSNKRPHKWRLQPQSITHYAILVENSFILMIFTFRKFDFISAKKNRPNSRKDYKNPLIWVGQFDVTILAAAAAMRLSNFASQMTSFVWNSHSFFHLVTPQIFHLVTKLMHFVDVTQTFLFVFQRSLCMAVVACFKHVGSSLMPKENKSHDKRISAHDSKHVKEKSTQTCCAMESAWIKPDKQTRVKDFRKLKWQKKKQPNSTG